MLFLINDTSLFKFFSKCGACGQRFRERSWNHATSSETYRRSLSALAVLGSLGLMISYLRFILIVWKTKSWIYIKFEYMQSLYWHSHNTHTHICIYIYYMYVYLKIHMHTRTHTGIHTGVYTYMHACMHAYIHRYIDT